MSLSDAFIDLTINKHKMRGFKVHSSLKLALASFSNTLFQTLYLFKPLVRRIFSNTYFQMRFLNAFLKRVFMTLFFFILHF